MNLTKTCAQVAFIAVVLSVLGFIGTVLCFASDSNHSYTLKIQSDSEVDSLIEAHDLVKAEGLAREKNLDPRVIAVICALAGKKDEAFTLFSDFIRGAPEAEKKELAFQSVNLLRNVAVNLGDEFFRHLISNRIISLSDDQISCAEVALLVRSGKIEEAENKMNLLLDSTYAENDLIDVAILLVAHLNMNLQNLNKVEKMLERLLKKFPNNLRVKLQWIGSLAAVKPPKALIELDNLKKNSPEFYEKYQPFIRSLRGHALDKMGEIDRAKTEYQEIVGHDSLGGMAKDKIEYYEAMDRLEQELREKIDQVKRPEYELTPRPRRWGVIILVNAVFIALILYTIYRRKKQ